MVDPWEHRSENMKCKTCMWFAPKGRVDQFVDLGRCRRHAPTMSGYPAVFVNDWCGDHKLDENRLFLMNDNVQCMPAPGPGGSGKQY